MTYSYTGADPHSSPLPPEYDVNIDLLGGKKLEFPNAHQIPLFQQASIKAELVSAIMQNEYTVVETTTPDAAFVIMRNRIIGIEIIPVSFREDRRRAEARWKFL